MQTTHPWFSTLLFFITFLIPLSSIAQECISGDCDDGQGKYLWENGTTAEGVWSDGIFGEGKMVTENGYIYEGKFKEYRLVGKGTKTWPEGLSIFGKWIDDIPSGKLVITWETGVVAEGKFEGTTMKGNGTVTTIEGVVFKGKFVDGVLRLSDTEQIDQWGTFSRGVFEDGLLVLGTQTWAEGGIDTGVFLDGNLEGEGMREWSDGDVFQGVFEKDILIEGTKVYITGITLEGDFENHIMYGLGTRSAKGYYVFKGVYADGEPNGFGVITFENGDTYEGDWVNGVLRYTDELAVSKYGTMYNGVWEGEEFVSGMRSFCDGEYLKGSFVNNTLHGYGTWFSEGSLYEGEWVEGTFSGHGTILTFNGVQITGTFSSYVINGPGTLVYSDGSEYSGNWENGWLWLDDETLIFQSGIFKSGVFNNTDLVSGILHYPDGSYVKGVFEEEYLVGEGVEYAVDDFIATGTFFKGWFVEGLLERDNGVICEGNFWGSHLDGEGSMQMPNQGEFFSGTWADGVLVIGDSIIVGDHGVIVKGELNSEGFPHGHATVTTIDNVETGLYSDGDFMSGTKVYNSGLTLIGEWDDDGFVRGSRVWATGVINEGGFLNGDLHGFGTLTLLDGSVYKGDWVKGYLTISAGVDLTHHGLKLIGVFDSSGNSDDGEIIMLSGASYKGEWVDFQIVEGVQATIYGLVTEGDFSSGYIHGLGTKSVPDKGLMVECQWHEGCRVPASLDSSAFPDDYKEVWISGDVTLKYADLPLEGAVIEVFKDGELYDITVCDELFSLYLMAPNVYTISISHEGYLPKSFILDLSEINAEHSDFLEFEFTTGLYAEVEGFDMGLLMEPLGKFKYDIKIDEFSIDYEYYEGRKDIIELELKRLGVDLGQ